MRIALVSLHTSPAAQPGSGDAGGLNVYAMATARTMAAAGHTVEIFTADPAAAALPGGSLPIEPGIRLHQLHSPARDKDGLGRDIPRLAGQLAAHPLFAHTDLIWAHYWISAAAAQLARTLLARPHAAAAAMAAPAMSAPAASALATVGTDTVSTEAAADLRTRAPGAPNIPPSAIADPLSADPGPADIVPIPESPDPLIPPLAVTFHTIAAVKNRDTGSANEPEFRLLAESRIARAADVIVANTSAEAHDIRDLLKPGAARIVVAPPGIDHRVFTPGDRGAARSRLGLEAQGLLVLYVGRMQFVKGTDIAIDALGELRKSAPELAGRTALHMLGAASGGADTGAFTELARTAEVADRVTVHPPVPAERLADWYRAADAVIVPSRSESFGFVAAEAQAAGAPVLAAAVGGLRTVVADGRTGLLVAGQDPGDWARALQTLLADDALRARLGSRGPEQAARCQWSSCVAAVLTAIGTAGTSMGSD